jgi:hypothetical protein
VLREQQMEVVRMDANLERHARLIRTERRRFRPASISKDNQICRLPIALFNLHFYRMIARVKQKQIPKCVAPEELFS